MIPVYVVTRRTAAFFVALWLTIGAATGLLVSATACKPGEAATVANVIADVGKIIECVDEDLAKGLSPAETAVDCGLKDAAAVENIVGASERLAARRAARGKAGSWSGKDASE